MLSFKSIDQSHAGNHSRRRVVFLYSWRYFRSGLRLVNTLVHCLPSASVSFVDGYLSVTDQLSECLEQWYRRLREIFKKKRGHLVKRTEKDWSSEWMRWGERAVVEGGAKGRERLAARRRLPLDGVTRLFTTTFSYASFFKHFHFIRHRLRIHRLSTN